jgi:hypothetical protein
MVHIHCYLIQEGDAELFFVSLKHMTVFLHWDMDVFDVVFEDEPTDFV